MCSLLCLVEQFHGTQSPAVSDATNSVMYTSWSADPCGYGRSIRSGKQGTQSPSGIKLAQVNGKVYCS